MIQWENNIVIMRPAKAVFDFVLDPAQAAGWHAGIETMRLLSEGAVGVGTRYKMTLKVPGSQNEAVTEITEYEVNRSVTFTSVSGPMPLVERYTMEDAQGGTRLTEIGELQLSGGLRLMSPVIGALQRRNSANGLRKARAILEERV